MSKAYSKVAVRRKRKPVCSLHHLGYGSWFALLVFIVSWGLLVPSELQFGSLFLSCGFSVIEWLYYRHSSERSDGTVSLSLQPVRGGHTTVEQWIMNLLFIPVFVFGYRACIKGTLLRCLLSPLNIWMLEIVEGSVLGSLYGYNPAWDYSGQPGSAFRGLIQLSYWKLWIGLQILIELTLLVFINSKSGV